MAAGDRDAITAAAIAELQTEMRYLREDLATALKAVAECRVELAKVTKAKWFGMGIVLGIGGGGTIVIQKLLAVLPALGK